jgi:predicted component of type VI protein secretion system
MSAMQSAIRSLLRDFAPAKLREEAAQGGRNLLPSQGKLRAWDLFEAQHAKLTQALSDDFDSAFGRAFARAYEQALREAQSGRTPA